MTFWAGFAWGAATVVVIVACYAWAAVAAAESFEDGSSSRGDGLGGER